MPDQTTTSSAGSDRIERWLQSGLFRWLAPPLVVIIAIIAGAFRGLPVALLVLACGVLLLVITLLWNSLQALTGESPITLDEALALGAPSAEEEQKRAVLRALKDLEYEHSVGKISEEDYTALTTRYRAEAKALLRSLDQNLAPNRERAEKLLEERLAGADLEDKPRKNKRAARKKAEDKPRDKEQERTGDDEDEESDSSPESGPPKEEAEATSSPEPGPPAKEAEASAPESGPSAEDADASQPARPAPTRRCPACDIRNDLDARFCKGCGKAMAEAGQALCSACPAVYETSEAVCPECGVPREDA